MAVKTKISFDFLKEEERELKKINEKEEGIKEDGGG
jgi:hypothetical protein